MIDRLDFGNWQPMNQQQKLFGLRLAFAVLLAMACNLGLAANPGTATEDSANEAEKSVKDETAEVAPNTLTDEEKSAGWILLFDGKTTNGWRNYKKQGISDGWQIIDGTMARVKERAGDIITRDTYGAFELSLEYKIAKGTNSGIMFHVLETGKKPWETGPEVQIIDNDALAGVAEPQYSGWLYQLYAPKQGIDATKPPGEWNHVRLLVTPEKGETTVNGVKYYEFVVGSDEWNQLVAKGKFKALPAFAKAGSGHICLQDHNGEIAFRNIKLRRLNGPAAAAQTK